MPEVLKKSSKQGINLQPFQIFKTMRNVFYFRLGIGNSAESFQSKLIVPRYLKHSLSQGARILLLFCEEFLNCKES